MTIYFSPEAEADLVAVVEYLAERNAVAAAELGQRMELLSEAGGRRRKAT